MWVMKLLRSAPCLKAKNILRTSRPRVDSEFEECQR